MGEGVKNVSEFSFDSVGQALDGVWNTASGMVQKDPLKQQQGLEDLKDAGGRTLKGVGQTLKSAGSDVSNVYQGVRDGDYDRALYGAKKLGEKVAVGVITVGVIDLAEGIDSIDGAEPVSAAEAVLSNDTGTPVELSGNIVDLDTPNEQYTGGVHPVTNVPLIEKEVLLLNGSTGIGTFPHFDEAYEVQLPRQMYLESDDAHFSYANVELKDAVNMDPEIGTQFTNEQLQQIQNAETPDGYTWHHSEELGRLELVQTETHHATGHLGGRELWGGGEEYR